MCKGVKNVLSFSPDEFTKELFEKYESGFQPIVIRNFSAIKNPEVFGFDYFKSLYDEGSPVLANYNGECGFVSYDRQEFKNMSQAFGMSRARYHSEDKSWYFGWANCDDRVVDYMEKNHVDVPEFVPSVMETMWLFLGRKGPGFAMHIDGEGNPSWQAQIAGVKKWILRPVAECRPRQGLFGFFFHEYRDLCMNDEFTVKLYPNDLLLVHTDIYEHSTAVEEEMSISMSCNYESDTYNYVPIY